MNYKLKEWANSKMTDTSDVCVNMRANNPGLGMAWFASVSVSLHQQCFKLSLHLSSDGMKGPTWSSTFLTNLSFWKHKLFGQQWYLAWLKLAPKDTERDKGPQFQFSMICPFEPRLARKGVRTCQVFQQVFFAFCSFLLVFSICIF